jgi:hypothetical protein
MGKQVRFYITWSFNRDMVPGAWHSEEDHLHLANLELVRGFKGYAPKLETTVRDLGGLRSEISMIWDLTLDVVPGGWHSPETHQTFLEMTFLQRFADYDAELEVQVYQLADKTGGKTEIDHGTIFIYTNGLAIKDDYPVFRPAVHPAWPEANEVFLQDGHWWWSQVDADGNSDTGPAVGPEPEAIYMPYTEMPVSYAA